MKEGKVVLIGTGFVGMSMAYTMLNRGGVSELILIDIDEEKTKGEEMDLNHGIPFAPQKMIIKAGNYEDCKDAHVIVITAGVAQKQNETRLELTETNARVMKSIVQNIMKSGFNGVIIVASNPVDLMTYIVAKVSGLPKNKVFGSGTILDSARLRYILSKQLNVSAKNIHAYVMGEHGDSSFVPWEHTYMGCKKITEIVTDIRELNSVHKEVVNSAYEIIDRKKATYYGIGMSLSKLVKAVLDNDNSIVTVSAYLDNGEYGQDDIYIGVPAIINENGVREILHLELSEEDKAKLNNSSKVIKENILNLLNKIIDE